LGLRPLALGRERLNSDENQRQGANRYQRFGRHIGRVYHHLGALPCQVDARSKTPALSWIGCAIAPETN
jgi:hypothetical protein